MSFIMMSNSIICDSIVKKCSLKKYMKNVGFFFANLFTYILCLNIFLLVLRWYGIPVDISVDLSTLWSKYFHRFKIFSNFTIFDSKICFKIFWKDWNYKGPSAIRTHDLFNAIAKLTFDESFVFPGLIVQTLIILFTGPFIRKKQ